MCTIIIAGDRKLKSILAEETEERGTDGGTDRGSDRVSDGGSNEAKERRTDGGTERGGREGDKIKDKAHTETQTLRTGSCGKGKNIAYRYPAITHSLLRKAHQWGKQVFR